MCLKSKPKVQAAPSLPEVPARPPRPVDADVIAARGRERSRIAGSSGRQSTILTGSRGLDDDANTRRKQILGA